MFLWFKEKSICVKKKSNMENYSYLCAQNSSNMKRFAIITVSFCFCAISSFCQTGKFYTSEQVSSSMIALNSIAQDAEGYIWMGTEYGLNRFDGFHFVTFLNNPNDTTSLGFNLITTIFCDDTGYVWVGTQKGLDRYEPTTRSFIHFKFPDNLHPRVTRILRLRDRRLVVATAGYGLYLAQENNHRMERLSAFSPNDNFFSNMYEDSHGNLWKNNVTNDFSCKNMYNDSKPLHFTSTVGIPMGFAEKDGNVLILCKHGLLIYKNGQLLPYDVSIDITNPQDVLYQTISTDNLDNIYIGTRGYGVFVLPAGSNKLERVECTNRSIDLNCSNVWGTLCDRNNNLWIACRQKGLLMIPNKRPYFNYWSFSAQNYKIGSPVTAICEGDHGMIWCSVQNNGIYGFDSNGNLVAHPKAPRSVEYIFRDRQKGYWIGTNNALYRYNPNTGDYQLAFSLDCDKFNDLTEDRNGNIYASTFYRGFCKYNRSSGKMINYHSSLDDERNEFLCNNWIQDILTDRKGLVWLASSRGISCYDPVSNTFNGLGWHKNIMCYSLCEIPNGDILIGTEQGIYIYHRQENSVEEYPHSSELMDKAINGIICDKDGDIWCSTSMGIWYLNSAKQRWVSYINGNGLATHEYTINANLYDKNGNIYFGTADGICMFNPELIEKQNTTIGDVRLTSLQIADKFYPTKDVDAFTVSYRTNSFALEFSLFDFSDSENTVFEYKFHDKENWTSLYTGQNTVHFNNLASGTYHLQVRAVVNGQYSEVKEYTITITTPWYLSGWAYMCYIVMSLLVIVYLIYIYIRAKRRQLDDEKMKFLINATHDIRSPLTLIMSPLAKLKQRHQSSEDREELGLIEHNTQRILSLVNQILDMRKIDKQQMKLQCQETHLVKYISGIFNMYKYNAVERNINYTFSHPEEDILVWIDHTQFDKVISNLLSNAFKYTFDGGSIHVRLDYAPDNQIRIMVSDDGVGIKDVDKKHIFDRFYQGRQSGDVHIEGTGIGLNLCKMIIEMHHGMIEVRDGENGKGSCFVVTIPSGNKHLQPDEIAIQATNTKSQSVRPNTHYRILVVDDDDDLCEYIKNELSRYYHIKVCHNGREAIKVLFNDTIDLVISDVMMPEMDGLTLLRMMKKNPVINHIPVIMLTSKVGIANRLEGISQGADAFMPKPFNIQELHVLINSLINNVLRLKGKFSGAQQQKENVSLKEMKSNDEVFMERVMEVVNKHFDDSDLDSALLAKEAGISRTHLQRKIKEVTGLSTAEFVRNLRLEQAARLLEEQKINISQVAYAVGFVNIAHFSTVFKKHFGVTPSDYIRSKV